MLGELLGGLIEYLILTMSLFKAVINHHQVISIIQKSP